LSFGEVPVVGSDCGVDTSISPVADSGKKSSGISSRSSCLVQLSV